MFLTKLLVISCFCSVYASGKRDRIIGGNDAPDQKYPFMASLRSRGSHFCAGSLINARWILSAAHCFHSIGLADELSAVLGSNQLYNSQDGQEFKVVDLIIHKEFDIDRGYKNDLALSKLDKAVATSARIKTIKISTDRLPNDLTVMVIGWGNTNPSTETVTTSNNLKELVQVAKDLDTCEGTYKYTYKTQLCVWSPIKKSGGCIGDSGGPLVTSKGTQVGILSMGSVPCAQNLPTLYTDVSQYIEWIKENLNDE